jgi:hypothetical protein
LAVFAKRLERAGPGLFLNSEKKKKKKKNTPISKLTLTFLLFILHQSFFFIIIQIKILLQNKFFTFFHIKYIFFTLSHKTFLLKPIKHISLNKPKKTLQCWPRVQLVPASWQTQPKGLRPLIKAFRVTSLLY